MTKIIFGINVPIQGTKRIYNEKDICAPSMVIPWIWNKKELSFELCDICGSQVVAGRAKRGYTTCSPACNQKKWNVWGGLVIERERNACGVRPKSFWGTISRECFTRDAFTCTRCRKTREDLHKVSAQNRMEKGWKYDDYALHCHHIMPIKDGGNNKLENLKTLCGKCHKIEHSRKKKVEKQHVPLAAFGV